MSAIRVDGGFIAYGLSQNYEESQFWGANPYEERVEQGQPSEHWQFDMSDTIQARIFSNWHDEIRCYRRLAPTKLQICRRLVCCSALFSADGMLPAANGAHPYAIHGSWPIIIINKQHMTSMALEQQLENVLQGEQKAAQPAPTPTTEDLSAAMDRLNLQQNFHPQQPQEQELIVAQTPSTAAQEEHHEPAHQYHTKDFIELTRNNITFDRNVLYPGSIDEVDLTIGLKEDAIPDDDPSAAYLLRIIALCANSEFNDLDEYVFSVRSNERYEYYEQVRFRIKKREKAQVRIAVKVPVVRQPYLISGTLTVQLQSTVPVVIPITCRTEIPQIVCMKELFEVAEGTPVIKLPAKKNMRIPPIPFKNNSAFQFVLQAETSSTESFQDRAYDIVSQSTVNCMANTPFFINLQLKTNMSYRGPMPVSDIIRKVLLLKVKNSTVYFSYPIEAYIFESNSSSNVS